MRQLLSLVWVLVAVATGAPSRAAASVEPLVVVVEAAPGNVVDPVEVRQAIAAELRSPVRAPRDPAAEETSDLLIVMVDRAEIRMSLRSRAASVVARAVPAAGDRKARLQSIGWLAGNLARDQVSAIVALMPAPASVSAAAVEAEPAPRPEVPPPAPPPATEPPPFADKPAREPAAPVGGVVASQPAPALGDGGPVWSLAIGGGPSAFWPGTRDRPQPSWPGPGIWYLEVQRRPSVNGLFLGGVLEVGPDMAPDLAAAVPNFVGGAGFVGFGHRYKRIFGEATAGFGLEAYQSSVQVNSTPMTTPEGGVIEGTTGVPAVSLGLYLRGQVTAGVALSRSFDLMASAGGHLGSAGRHDVYMTTSLGLRYRFQ